MSSLQEQLAKLTQPEESAEAHTTEEQIRQVIAKVLGIEDQETIADDVSLVDKLGASSLDLIELAVRLEQTFGFPVEAALFPDNLSSLTPAVIADIVRAHSAN